MPDSIDDRITAQADEIRARWDALPVTSTNQPPPRVWTVGELEDELDAVRKEIRLIDHLMALPEKPSPEDQELYAERMIFLATALGQLPNAIKAVQAKEKLKRPGFQSLEVKWGADG